MRIRLVSERKAPVLPIPGATVRDLVEQARRSIRAWRIARLERELKVARRRHLWEMDFGKFADRYASAHRLMRIERRLYRLRVKR
jgi:hypothetical protein